MQQDPDVMGKGRIPDKEAALVMLHALLGKPDYVPKGPVDESRLARLEAERAKVTKQHAAHAETDATPLPPRIVTPLPTDIAERLRRRLGAR